MLDGLQVEESVEQPVVYEPLVLLAHVPAAVGAHRPCVDLHKRADRHRGAEDEDVGGIALAGASAARIPRRCSRNRM